jgi:hypothetical protein
MCAVYSRNVTALWALRLASRGEYAATLHAVSVLERIGDDGAPSLLVLANDLRIIPDPRTAQHAGRIPPDSVCDLALDALRRMRNPRSGARTFEWFRTDEVSDYHLALMAYRQRELDAAMAWWDQRSKGNRTTRP